jgi:two-component sensor histidine kinase
MRSEQALPHAFAVAALSYLVVLVTVPLSAVNVAVPLVLVPCVLAAITWGPWAGLISALAAAAADLVAVEIRWSGYLPANLTGFIMGHLNVVLSAVFVGVFVRLWRAYKRENAKRQESEERLRDALEHKALLFREVHHRVKNHLDMLAHMVELKGATVENVEARSCLSGLQDQITTVGLIHAQLYEEQSGEGVDLQRYLRDLAERTAGGLSDTHRRIETVVEVPQVIISPDAATPIGLAVSELVTNAHKHAFPGRSQGTIWVRATVNERTCRLAVENDGDPFPDSFDFDDTGTLGLRLVRSLAMQLRGNAQVISFSRRGIELIFPLPAQGEAQAEERTKRSL